VPRSDSDLRAAAAGAAFTPPAAEVPRLLALYAASDGGADLARALARQPAAAARATRAALADAVAPARARLVELLGRLALAAPERDLDLGLADDLARLTDDADPRASRLALVALGKIGGAAAEEALLTAVRNPRSPAHRRAAVDALGKIGGPSARAALADLPGGDAELDRVAARARLRVERTLGRDAASSIDDQRPLPGAHTLVFTCRPGLEPFLADELGAPFAAGGPGRVVGPSAAPLAALYRARLFVELGLRFPLAGHSAEAIAAALAAPEPRRLLGALTQGVIRYRLAFAAGGHRRALVQDIATRVAKRAPELINDPTATTWEVEVGPGELIVRPRRLVDPRFTYRVRDVPAASHPTVAAALARLGGARPDDIVWDPFVGSGSELVERARLGPARALIGSDRDPAALDAARTNLAAAGVEARLEPRDALMAAPPGLTLVLTNPPMGRRVARPDLGRFVEHIGRALAPGGRFVWLSPQPRLTREHAARAGLRLVQAQTVDLGGFTAELELFEKPTSRPLPSTSTPRRSRA
jgi:predicted RNA methylase